MKKVIVVMALLGSTLGAYPLMAQHTGHGKAALAQKSEVASHKVSPVFQQQLKAVFETNVALKEAFVASDAAKVKAQARAIKDALAKVDMKQVQGQAHSDWMNYYNELNTHINAIAQSSDLKEQRTHYQSFSQVLYKSIKAFGLDGQEAYYQYCPMAFNNQGGYWLSDSKEIRNPYYGSQMLKCGSTKEVIPGK